MIQYRPVYPAACISVYPFYVTFSSDSLATSARSTRTDKLMETSVGALTMAVSMKFTVNECPMSGGAIFLVVLIVLAVVGGVAAAVM